MSQDTNVNNLIINKLTKQQYEGITNPDPTQLYFITDDNGIASLDDISLSSLSNGQILKYNSTSGKWENANLPAEVTETTVTNWGFTKNVGTVTSVNNVSPVNGNVSLTIPSEVTETTVTNWGFTKNVGTVTSVNNVSPVNGNVSLTIPTITDTYSSTSSDGMSGKAVASALSNSGFITGITSSDVTSALGYTPYNGATNPNGYTSNVGTVTKVNNTSPDSSGNVTLTIPDPLPTQTGNSGKYLTTNGTTASWATVDALPSQTSQSGKFLTTNGSTASWADVPTEIPTQTGNSGKYLTTNGSTVSWATVDALPSQTSQSGKFLTTNGTTASWADVPTEIPTQTGNSGKFLTTNGTTASWAAISIPTVDQTYDSTSTNAQSGVAIAGAGFLQNTATGTNALTIAGTAATSNTATNVGTGTSVTATAGTAIGRAAEVSGTYGTGLGTAAKVTAAYGIQIGYGTNSTASTLSVGFNASSSANRKNWQLLDGTTGYIPNERINMDTTPTSASTNTVTSGGVYTALSDKVEYAMVITDYTA